jgi:hypothetical protein
LSANGPRRQGKLRHDEKNHALDGSGPFANYLFLGRGKGRSDQAQGVYFPVSSVTHPAERVATTRPVGSGFVGFAVSEN